MSWGEPGSDPGQFNLVHDVSTTRMAGSMSPTARTTGFRCLTARQSTRRNGTICTGRAGSTCRTAITRSAVFGELSVNRLNANLGPRVSIVDNQGKLLSRIGDPFAGQAPTAFIGPHGLTVDSRGDLYVGEVCWTLWPGLFPGQPHPPGLRALQKYERVH